MRVATRSCVAASISSVRQKAGHVGVSAQSANECQGELRFVNRRMAAVHRHAAVAQQESRSACRPSTRAGGMPASQTARQLRVLVLNTSAASNRMAFNRARQLTAVFRLGSIDQQFVDAASCRPTAARRRG